MKNIKFNKWIKKLTMLAVGCCFTAVSVLPAFASAHDKKPMPPQKPGITHHHKAEPAPLKKPCKPAKPDNKPMKPDNKPPVKPAPKPMPPDNKPFAPPHHNSHK